MQKLTKSIVDRARREAATMNHDVFYWDGSLPGFGVRAKPSGTISFMIQYRNEFNRSRRHTIGRYGVMTLEEARKEARDLLSASARGRDPRADRVKKKSDLTIEDLAKRYMSEHCEGRCKPSTIEAHRWLLGKFILPRIGRLKISEVSGSDIHRLHQNLKETPYNANRVLGLLRAMYGKADDWGLIQKGEIPTAQVKRFGERKRQRFLSPDELNKLARTIDAVEEERSVSRHVAGAFRLLILTGARLNEVRLVKWNDIDWEQRYIYVREHKTDDKGPKTIPLNAAAIEVLKAIPREINNPYIIAGKKPGEPVVNLQKPWRRIRERADIPDVRIHDLRHSFASFGVTAGASLPVIGGLLGHRSMAATATYAHLATDPLREATEKIGEIVGKVIRADR